MSLSEFVVVSSGRVVFEGPLSQCGEYAEAHPETTIFERSKSLSTDPSQPIPPSGRSEARRHYVKRLNSELGLYTMAIPKDAKFFPASQDSQPPSRITGFPKDEICKFAVMLNRSEWSGHKKVWAAVTENGGLMLLPCAPEDRPTDPTAFLPGVRVMEWEEAKNVAWLENRDRCAVALTPREWSIALRPLARFAD